MCCFWKRKKTTIAYSLKGECHLLGAFCGVCLKVLLMPQEVVPTGPVALLGGDCEKSFLPVEP